MKSVKGSVDTELEVGRDGTAIVPVSTLRELGVAPGSKLSVRISSRSLTRRLLEQGVTEQEIEAISALQLERRESVVQFLQAEGVLSNDAGFVRRARKVVR
jgi:hypothetical protein